MEGGAAMSKFDDWQAAETARWEAHMSMTAPTTDTTDLIAKARERWSSQWIMASNDYALLLDVLEAAERLLDHELDDRGQVLEVDDNGLHMTLRAAIDAWKQGKENHGT
jgi:hypothetical protein